MNVKLMLVCLTAVLATASMSFSEEAQGKELFLESKCNGCHAVESQGIEAKSDRMKAPDMSNAAELIPSAEWAMKFVQREEEKDGKKHMRPWKGSQEDLEQIVNWLMTLQDS